MEYDIRITPEQAIAIGRWAQDCQNMADVLVQVTPDGFAYVGQGDSRATFRPDGACIDPDEVIS